MPAKYEAGLSTGQPFEVLETLVVAVTAEALSQSSGYKGESITYTATVLDNLGNGLPAAFVLDLKIGGITLIAGQVLNATVYDPVTGALSLTWTVPDTVGTFTVTISWAEQII